MDIDVLFILIFILTINTSSNVDSQIYTLMIFIISTLSYTGIFILAPIEHRNNPLTLREIKKYKNMRLSNLRPAEGSTKTGKRIGRGTGSGLGGTSTRGHKGAKSRSGYSKKLGFEGGQMPIQRRLPKFGFVSLKAMDRAEVRTSELAKVDGDVVSLQSLKDANIINQHIQRVKVMLSGEVGRAVTLKGIAATKGARAAIEAAGGKFEE